VTIPNSSFTDNPVENVTLEPKRKVTLNLGLTYDTSPEKIEEAIVIAREIAKEISGVEDAIKV
jgi:MscS family membrane protein